MELSIHNFETPEQVFQLVKVLLENNIELHMNWKNVGFDKRQLFQHQGLADLLMKHPFACENKNTLNRVFPYCVGLMDDVQLSKKLSEHYCNNRFIDYEEDILLQCLFNNKSECAKILLPQWSKYENFLSTWEIDGDVVSNAHYVKNGTIMPCWQPNIVGVLESLNAPVSLFIPSEISKDTYIMDYSSILGAISKYKACIPSYQSVGTYFWKNSQVEFLTLITFHSKELMYQWWESVKNIIKQ